MSFAQSISRIFTEAGRRIPVLAAFAAFLVLYLPAAFGSYGLFVDELYYLAGAQRPAAGYVDHPPLSVLLLYLTDADSIELLRLFPALCGALTVFLAASFVRVRLGSPAAQLLAGAAVLSAPVLLVLFGFYSMNSFEVLFITVLCTLISEMIRRERPLWIWFGVIAGFAVLNKHTSAVYIVSLIGALLFTQERRILFHKSAFAGAGVALLIVMPNLIWQFQNSFVSLEFYSNASSLKNVSTPPHMVLVNQILSANPLSFVVWAAGLGLCLRSELRVFGISYLFCLLLLAAAQSSRPDRIAAFYPVLFACGALFFDRKPVLRVVSLILVFAGFVFFLPVGLPVLSPEQTGRNAAALGVVPSIEQGRKAALPQWFADRLGWPETGRMASQAARAAGPDTLIIAGNYGLAGAVEKFGDSPVVSPHNSYYFWGAARDLKSYRRAVLLGIGPQAAERICSGQPQKAGVIERPYSAPVEMLVCETNGRLADLWPSLKRFH